MGMASIEDVKQFLENAKSLIKQGKFALIPRKKNLDGLALLGLTLRLAKLELLELSYRQYDRGPIPDRDRQGEMFWEFIKDIEAKTQGKVKFSCPIIYSIVTAFG